MYTQQYAKLVCAESTQFSHINCHGAMANDKVFNHPHCLWVKPVQAHFGRQLIMFSISNPSWGGYPILTRTVPHTHLKIQVGSPWSGSLTHVLGHVLGHAGPGRYDPPSGQLLQQESLPLGSSRLALERKSPTSLDDHFCTG